MPVDDERLRDFLPDGLGGHVPVVQGPVAIASRVVRLADHDQHREAWVLRRQESDERGPDILRVLAVDGDLRSAGLAGLVELEAFDPRRPARALLHDLLHHRGHLGRGLRRDRLPLWLEQDRVDVCADALHDVRRRVLAAVGDDVGSGEHLDHVDVDALAE